MKENVDLTENQSFSRGRQRLSFENRLVQMHNTIEDCLQNYTGRKSRFNEFLHISHWTVHCIPKSTLLQSFGVSRFLHKQTSNDSSLDYLLDDSCQCPRCGRTKVPWRYYCKQCRVDMREDDDEDRNMSLGDYNNKYNTWPRVRDVMRSDPSILYR